MQGWKSVWGSIFLFSVSWTSAVDPGIVPEGARDNHIRVMLGSCNKADREPRFWDLVLHRRPSAWVWMGDNVYADKKRSKLNFPSGLFNALKSPYGMESAFFEPANMSEMQKMYESVKAHPTYKLLSQSTQIFGTWDDHDYGLNDGDRRFVDKHTSQRLLLDFLDEPADSPQRKQEGVYWSHLVCAGGRSVRVVLLDVRSGKTPYPSWPFRFQSWEAGAEFLSEEQWGWLERTLRESEADAHLVVSGLQILPEFRWQGENW
eukprot:CAMPEP_0196724924 /NCGR_PEP_ID=MMETSP1091-20130531/6629_1 /TAXON_ID=302021 /ORGANISM="Rhodomonas sp., Strain CCMP768" /LENGTH=260 /DNA_ID=CAMNT_0042067129 /DNA_START=17 /DNA_END=796 /DNA_ORIENTATION=-